MYWGASLYHFSCQLDIFVDRLPVLPSLCVTKSHVPVLSIYTCMWSLHNVAGRLSKQTWLISNSIWLGNIRDILFLMSSLPPDETGDDIVDFTRRGLPFYGSSTVFAVFYLNVLNHGWVNEPNKTYRVHVAIMCVAVYICHAIAFVTKTLLNAKRFCNCYLASIRCPTVFGSY